MAVLPTERLLHLFHLCLSNHVLVCVILQWFVYRYLLFKPDRSVGFGSSNLSLGKNFKLPFEVQKYWILHMDVIYFW
jgi:hypothetical protein